MLSTMSQQPPWETHIQPGWGVPQPPENPPQQPQPPQQGGGWNQGSYAPPQPQQMPPQPQYPPPPSQSGAGQYPGFGQPPPPPQFTPPLMPGQPYQDQLPPKNGNRRTIVFAVIGTVAIVGAAVGIYLATNKSSSDSTGKTTSATTSGPASPSAPEASTSSFPDNSYTGSASGNASTAAPPSSAAAGGGATLDNAATDKTPFTQAGMVATTFTDSKKVVYTLKAAGPKPCDKVGDAVVEPIVKSAKCTDFMAASWTDPDGRIIVSAMIIPYPDAPTATGIYQKLGVAHTGDYNQWCPPAPQPGADACTKLAKAGGVTREGKFGSFHRYMLITTAVYTDLRNDQSQKDWLVAAADGAFQNTLPGQ